MMDIASEVRVSAGLFPAVQTTTPTAAVFDRATSRALAIIVQVGPGGITFTGVNSLTILVEDSDDGTTYTNVTTGNLRTATGASQALTSGVVESYTAAKAAASTNEYGYMGGRRFVRVTATFAGTHATGTVVGITFVGGELAIAP